MQKIKPLNSTEPLLLNKMTPQTPGCSTGQVIKVVLVLKPAPNQQPLDELLPVSVDALFVLFLFAPFLLDLLLVPGVNDEIAKLFAHDEPVVHGVAATAVKVEARDGLGAIDA